MKKLVSILLCLGILAGGIGVMYGLINENSRPYTFTFVLLTWALTLWEMKRAPGEKRNPVKIKNKVIKKVMANILALTCISLVLALMGGMAYLFYNPSTRIYMTSFVILVWCLIFWELYRSIVKKI